MNKIKLFVAAALLAVLGSATSGAPEPMANPAIFGDWLLEMSGPPLQAPGKAQGKAPICVFAGDMTLVRGIPIKAVADKSFQDLLSGQALMEFVSGPCAEIPRVFGEIRGSASGENIMFQMAVFDPSSGPFKDGDPGSADKGPGIPLLILTFEGELLSDTLMEGEITDASLPRSKGEVLALWRAVRPGAIPAITPVGILLLLAGLGLAGGLALRRSR